MGWCVAESITMSFGGRLLDVGILDLGSVEFVGASNVRSRGLLMPVFGDRFFHRRWDAESEDICN